MTITDIQRVRGRFENLRNVQVSTQTQYIDATFSEGDLREIVTMLEKFERMYRIATHEWDEVRKLRRATA